MLNLSELKEEHNILPLKISFIYHHCNLFFFKIIMLERYLKFLRKLSKIGTLNLLILFSLTFGIYFTILKRVIGLDFDPSFSEDLNFALIVFGLAFIAISAIRYLDSATHKKDEDEKIKNSDLEDILSSKIKYIVEDLKRDATISLNKIEKEELLKDLRQQLESKVSEDYHQDVAKKIKNEWLESEIDLSIKQTTNRLSSEIKTLVLRSNLNLVIGMILCFLGILALYVFLQKNAEIYILAFKNHNINEVVLTLLPNAFFVLLIEIFSYFFLNLYKKSIEEIKFYQNELTNLESKFLALKTAKITNNHRLLNIILEEIVKTERNFILEQGQSTIEIEKEKISSNNSNNVIKAATELLNFKK